MLGRPLLLCPPAVIISPDDLVEETIAAKDLVQQHLAVMHFAVIDVEIQRAMRSKQTVGLFQARGKKGQVVVKDVGVGLRPQLDGLVAAPLKAGAVAVLRLAGLDMGAGLGAARC